MSTTVFGYGSLMSIPSTQSTMPSATHFRPGCLFSHLRIFNLVSILAIKNGFSNEITGEMSALAIRPVNNQECKVLGCLFDIPNSELPDYLLREQRYKPVNVSVLDLSINKYVDCLTVIENTDENYRKSISKDKYDDKVGKYYDGQLWGRKDIYPLREYLMRCIEAAFELGGQVFVDNFLDQTLLADEETILRKYIMNHMNRFQRIANLIQ